MKEDLKAWCQQHHCEALAQLAVHEGSREALLRAVAKICVQATLPEGECRVGTEGLVKVGR